MAAELCQGWTSRRDFRNNLPCGNKAQPGKPFCKVHDPERIEARDAARAKKWLEKRAQEAGHGR